MKNLGIKKSQALWTESWWETREEEIWNRVLKDIDDFDVQNAEIENEMEDIRTEINSLFQQMHNEMVGISYAFK